MSEEFDGHSGNVAEEKYWWKALCFVDKLKSGARLFRIYTAI